MSASGEHERGPVVAVVTPFYNSAPSLGRCIESVLGQDFADFEYILADNGSTDGSGDIASRAASRDSRIRYMRFDEHVPQTENYNRALRQISAGARWCKVVQADDYLMADCLGEMLGLAGRHPSVGVISSFRDEEGLVDPPRAAAPDEFTTGRLIGRATLRGEVFAFGSPTTVMYRADLVRARPLLYRPGAFFDDTDAVFDLLRECDFGFVHKVLSHTSRDPSSTFGRVRSFDLDVLYRHVSLARVGAAYFEDGELRALRQKVAQDYYFKVTRALVRRPERWRYLRFHRGVLREAAGLKLGAGRIFAEFNRKFMAKVARSLSATVVGGRAG